MRVVAGPPSSSTAGHRTCIVRQVEKVRNGHDDDLRLKQNQKPGKKELRLLVKHNEGYLNGGFMLPLHHTSMLPTCYEVARNIPPQNSVDFTLLGFSISSIDLVYFLVFTFSPPFLLLLHRLLGLSAFVPPRFPFLVVKPK